MTTRYPGGLIRKTPPTITPPVDGEGGSAPGVWTLEQASYYTKQGTWPLPIKQGALYTWGAGSNGRTGHNDLISRSSPTQVGSDVNWLLTANQAHTHAIKTNGTLWAWGAGTGGRTGLNDVIARSSPVQVGALTNWSKVAVTADASLAIKTDGTLWSWGNNANGQLGQNDRVARSSPVQIGSDTNWASVYGAQNNGFFAIKTTGALYSWGGDVYGNLGLNDNSINRSSPTQIGALTNWASVSNFSDYFSIAIKTDGTMWSWGNNSIGQLAQNDRVARSSPVQIGALTNWSKPAGSADSGAAIKADGTMWSWGDNANGELGQNVGTTTYRSSPVQIGALTTWSQISGGNRSFAALKTDGTFWSWGNNGGGQLGLGDISPRSSPVQIGVNNTWAPRFSVFGSISAIRQ